MLKNNYYPPPNLDKIRLLSKQLNGPDIEEVYYRLYHLAPMEYKAEKYQEPEKDEQGTFYGYKVLLVERFRLFSPVYPALWNPNGTLSSDEEPMEKNSNGIYCSKTCIDMQLFFIMIRFVEKEFLLVKCALSGTIVEGETGFRAKHARITEVFEHGHWQGYQNPQEYSRSYSYQEEEWWRESRLKGDWYTSS